MFQVSQEMLNGGEWDQSTGEFYKDYYLISM